MILEDVPLNTGRKLNVQKDVQKTFWTGYLMYVQFTSYAQGGSSGYHQSLKSIHFRNYYSDDSEPSQTSKMELFPKIVNGFQPFTIFVKSSIIDV